VRPANMRPAYMRRPEMHPAAACPEAYPPAVPAKPAAMAAKASEVSATTAMSAKASEVSATTAMSAKASEVSATTMPTATAAMSPAATMAAATAPATAGVCFECEKRHDDEQRRGNTSAGRQHLLHHAAGRGASRGRQNLGVSQRTKSL
jgi:hypothetical protein